MMKEEKKIAYEPHPVKSERKAELIKAGFKIIDVIFKPVEKTIKKEADKK